MKGGKKEHIHTHTEQRENSERGVFLTRQDPLPVFRGEALPSLRVADGVEALEQEGPQTNAQGANLLPEWLADGRAERERVREREAGWEGKRRRMEKGVR